MSLFSAMSVSASGMAAQRARAEVLVENLANSETTRTPEGGPYRRKDVVFASDPAPSLFSSIYRASLEPVSTGVRVAGIVVDSSPPESRYLPGHPDADAKGYVRYPNVNVVEEMVNMITASRAYEAGVTSVESIKAMARSALGIGR